MTDTESVAAGVQAVGSYLGLRASKKAAADASNLNEAMAKEGIRMRVKDAQLAGISPLAALGLPLAQPGGVAIGDPGYAQLGQDIGRAVTATSTHTERAQRTRLFNAQVTNQELQNDLLRTQIAKESAVGPALPSPTDHSDAVGLGQGDAVNLIPARVTASERGKPHKEAGAVSDMGLARTSKGYAVIPSGDIKQRVEDMLIPETAWAARNLFLPDKANKPPRSWLRHFGKNPYEYDWAFNHAMGEWRPVKVFPGGHTPSGWPKPSRPRRRLGIENE